MTVDRTNERWPQQPQDNVRKNKETGKEKQFYGGKTRKNSEMAKQKINEGRMEISAIWFGLWILKLVLGKASVRQWVLKSIIPTKI